mmetsp:Transcript_125511/g.313562  ORF Transcript_125511/g.313562 Transcript_125511/m.313562 type:complete len:327 (+) Transcript_125511:460-1440(+)
MDEKSALTRSATASGMFIAFGCRVTKPSKSLAASIAAGSGGVACAAAAGGVACGCIGSTASTPFTIDLPLETKRHESSNGTLASNAAKSQAKIRSVTRVLIAPNAFTPCADTCPSASSVSSSTSSDPGASCNCPETRRFAWKSFVGFHLCWLRAGPFKLRCTARGTSSDAAWLKFLTSKPCGHLDKFRDQVPKALSPILLKDLDTKSISKYSAASVSPPSCLLSCATAAVRAAARAPGAARFAWYAAAKRASVSQSGVKGTSGWKNGNFRTVIACNRGTSAVDGCRASFQRPSPCEGSKFAISGLMHKIPTISTVSLNRSASASLS